MIEETIGNDLSNEDAFELFQLLQEYVDSKTCEVDLSDKLYDRWRDEREGA